MIDGAECSSSPVYTTLSEPRAQGFVDAQVVTAQLSGPAEVAHNQIDALRRELREDRIQVS